MKINQLHNKHKGEVWIVGSDPTLASYPDNFLNDKLSITLHLAYVKFPGADYHYFNEMDRWTHLKSMYPKIKKKKMIFGHPFYNRTIEESNQAIGKVECYKLNLKPYPPNGEVKDMYTNVGQNAMAEMVAHAKLGIRRDFGGSGTCLHPAMYVAIIMGATEINIIGCGFKAIGEMEHFGSMHHVDATMRPKTATFTGARGERMQIGLNAIIRGCKKNGITVNRYKNYEQASNSSKKS